MSDGSVVATGVIFDGSFDGFLTVLYKYYYDKLAPSSIFEHSAFQQTFGTEYITVETEPDKSAKVLAAIRGKLSTITLEYINAAFLSCEEDRFMALLQYIVWAFKHPRDVDRYENLSFVLRVHKLSKSVNAEAHLLKGFVRFKKTRSGVFYSGISPKNNALPILCDHFADRLQEERWIIHDIGRHIAGVYNTSVWVLADTPKDFVINPDDDDERFRDLWKTFYNTIGIEERKNSKLRGQLMPKRFWRHMTEHEHR